MKTSADFKSVSVSGCQVDFDSLLQLNQWVLFHSYVKCCYIIKWCGSLSFSIMQLPVFVCNLHYNRRWKQSIYNRFKCELQYKVLLLFWWRYCLPLMMGLISDEHLLKSACSVLWSNSNFILYLCLSTKVSISNHHILMIFLWFVRHKATCEFHTILQSDATSHSVFDWSLCLWAIALSCSKTITRKSSCNNEFHVWKRKKEKDGALIYEQVTDCSPFPLKLLRTAEALSTWFWWCLVFVVLHCSQGKAANFLKWVMPTDYSHLSLNFVLCKFSSQVC